MKTPPIVTAEEWEAARQQLLVKEKELTRARDALAARRRRMPWLAIEKEYAFEGPQGKASLLEVSRAAASSSSTGRSSSPVCAAGPTTPATAAP